jgi:hypothetical protein
MKKKLGIEKPEIVGARFRAISLAPIEARSAFFLPQLSPASAEQRDSRNFAVPSPSIVREIPAVGKLSVSIGVIV